MDAKKIAFGAIIALCAIGGTAAVLLKAQPEERPPPNVMIVLWDTTRADHLNVYGYDKPTTPANTPPVIDPEVKPKTSAEMEAEGESESEVLDHDVEHAGVVPTGTEVRIAPDQHRIMTVEAEVDRFGGRRRRSACCKRVSGVCEAGKAQEAGEKTVHDGSPCD